MNPRLLLEPKSVKQMLRDQHLPLGGAIRANYTKAIDDCLWVYWLSAVADTGDVEAAACMCWDIVSRDPAYTHPLWLSLVFRRHKAAIVEAHHAGSFRH